MASLHRKPGWLIFGGETGPKPRPMQLEWAANIQRECGDFGVAFFMKQMSARTPTKAAALIPASLLIRQFPVPERKAMSSPEKYTGNQYAINRLRDFARELKADLASLPQASAGSVPERKA